MKIKVYSLLTAFFLAMNGCLLAQDDSMPPPDQSLWQTFVMIGIALMFFYFILWRPEQKKRKELEDQRNTLKKGDKVVAIGIIGTVVKVGEQTVILKMYDGAKLEFFKSAVTDIIPETGNGDKKVELIAEE